VLCFAVNMKSSFANLTSKWLPELNTHAPGIPIILVGLKAESREDAEAIEKDLLVPYADAVEFANQHNWPYFECSSKNMVSYLSTFFLSFFFFVVIFGLIRLIRLDLMKQ